MIDMSDVGADAGDNDNDNGHNCTENMIRMKFSGEFLYDSIKEVVRR